MILEIFSLERVDFFHGLDHLFQIVVGLFHTVSCLRHQARHTTRILRIAARDRRDLSGGGRRLFERGGLLRRSLRQRLTGGRYLACRGSYLAGAFQEFGGRPGAASSSRSAQSTAPRP